MNTRQTGLTLIELMVTLAVAIVLLAVGVPLFTGLAGSNRATTQANELVAALKLARSEAVNRADLVRVCSSNGGACGGAGDWANGWLVHSDINNNGSFDAGDVLRSWGALAPTSSVAITGGASVAFLATGEANGGYTFELDNSDATGSGSDAAKRCVSVTISGQVRSARGACP
ncbi:MAG: GspH/FimT family pseudopilin [Chromatiaceae bacterium]|nr:GspH/FimT family pseudopilin [Chromatiaceae bacterium]